MDERRHIAMSTCKCVRKVMYAFDGIALLQFGSIIYSYDQRYIGVGESMQARGCVDFAVVVKEQQVPAFSPACLLPLGG